MLDNSLTSESPVPPVPVASSCSKISEELCAVGPVSSTLSCHQYAVIKHLRRGLQGKGKRMTLCWCCGKAGAGLTHSEGASTLYSLLVTCLLPHNEREPVRLISLNAEARGRLHFARLLAASCSCPGCWAYFVKGVESLCLCCAMQRSQNCKTPATLLRSSSDGPCSSKGHGSLEIER